MKKRNKKTKISFDQELVTKQHAKLLISEENQRISDTQEALQPRKKLKRKSPPDEHKGDGVPSDAHKGNKKRLKESQIIDEEVTNKPPVSDTLEPPKKKTPSNRARKREKHAKLQEEHKLKTEVELQQKALNYLSKWKHSRSEWKFEKLRQVWLQQNLLDAAKIPAEFWQTVLQYFAGSKGHSRQAVLSACIKIIENDEKVTEEARDGDYVAKLGRARDLVQHLE